MLDEETIGIINKEEETTVKIDDGEETVVKVTPKKEFKKTVKKKRLRISNPIEDFLRDSHLLEKDKIEELSIKYQSISFSDVISHYIVDENNFYENIAKKLDLKYHKNQKELIKDSNFNLINFELSKNLGIIPLNYEPEEDEAKKLYIALHDPFDYETIDYLQSRVNEKIKISLAKESLLQKIIKKYEDNQNIDTYVNSNIDNDSIFTPEDIATYKFKSDKEAPIIKIVESIIINAKNNRVSDIHIEPTEDNLLIRYRIDGILKIFNTLPNYIHREVISRIKILSDLNVAEKRLPQDGRFNVMDTTKSEAQNVDIRVSTFPTIYGEKIVMRLLEQDALKPTLEDLNLTSKQVTTMKSKINSPYGLILITGPTGSGKTTTLYSALSTVDSETLNVLTVEDPVEYRLDGIHQMQVNNKIGLTFSGGLKTILRQDPDVIMVGEIRDLDTATMAIRASLTGHIVFSTIHTNDSIGVIIRLINMGIEPFLVASSVTLAVAQRLVRTICPKCAYWKEKEELIEELEKKGITQEKLNSLGVDINSIPRFAYGKGCEYCSGMGYRGRRAVFEFFEPTEEIIVEILKPNFDETRIREIAKITGMETLAKNTLELIKQELTTIEELLRVIGDK